jgi:adenine-specific DNA-methyltransferase
MELAEPAILVQRTSAPEQSRRLVASRLTRRHLEEFGGSVVIENHLNVLRPADDHPKVSSGLLSRILNSEAFDRLVRCISGSVALSAYELESLPLPSPHVLAQWEPLDERDLDAAIHAAYSEPLVSQ